MVETELSFHWHLWDPAVKAQILFLGGEICFIKMSNWRSLFPIKYLLSPSWTVSQEWEEVVCEVRNMGFSIKKSYLLALARNMALK